MHLGRDRVIAAHEVRGDADRGPGPGLDARDAARGPQRGAAGRAAHPHPPRPRLGDRSPGAPLARPARLRSEVGAPHLVEPRSCWRAPGASMAPENMDRLWGEVLPVPAANVVALAGGEEVEGFRVEHVPGHASHHLVLARPRRGRRLRRRHGRRADPARRLHGGAHAAAGDRRRGLAGSIDRIEAPGPERLRLTHFGVAEDVGGAARARARERAPCRRRRPRAGIASGSSRRSTRGSTPAPIPRPRAACVRRCPPDQAWQGLERYWRKRARPRPPEAARE